MLINIHVLYLAGTRSQTENGVWERVHEHHLGPEDTWDTMPSLQLRLVLSAGAGLLGLSGYSYFSGSPWFYRHVVMPTASLLDPETAHTAAVYLAAKGIVPWQRDKDPEILVSFYRAYLQIISYVYTCETLILTIFGYCRRLQCGDESL